MNFCYVRCQQACLRVYICACVLYVQDVSVHVFVRVRVCVSDEMREHKERRISKAIYLHTSDQESIYL